jgi:hypothetical protein
MGGRGGGPLGGKRCLAKRGVSHSAISTASDFLSVSQSDPEHWRLGRSIPKDKKKRSQGMAEALMASPSDVGTLRFVS